jgi:hypothetical protein
LTLAPDPRPARPEAMTILVMAVADVPLMMEAV